MRFSKNHISLYLALVSTVGAFKVPTWDKKATNTVVISYPEQPSQHRNDDNTATLMFSTDSTHQSETISKSLRGSLREFMSSKEAKALLISAGGNRHAEVVPKTPDLIKLWEVACQNSYGPDYLPDDENHVLIATESVIALPGLRLISTSLSGTKMIKGKDGNPEHVFVLIGERNRVEGPVSMMFNKISRTSKNSGDQAFHKPSSTAITRVSIAEGSDGYAIQYEINVKVSIELPKVLIRMLPVSKELAEAQGSASIAKVIAKDVGSALNAAHDALLKTAERLALQPYLVAA